MTVLGSSLHDLIIEAGGLLDHCERSRYADTEALTELELLRSDLLAACDGTVATEVADDAGEAVEQINATLVRARDALPQARAS